MKKHILSLVLLVSTSYVFGAEKVALAVKDEVKKDLKEVVAKVDASSWVTTLRNNLTIDKLVSGAISLKNDARDYANTNPKATALIAILSAYSIYKSCPWMQRKATTLRSYLPNCPFSCKNDRKQS